MITLYKNHGNNIGYWKCWTDAQWVITEHASKMDGKPIQKKYEAQVKNAGRSNEKLPFEQAILEMESKTRLKLDKGYVRSLEEAKAPATNSMNLLMPMLATPLDKVKPEKIDWETTYVQPKLDGHRALFKDGVLYSRQGKALDIPHIVEAIQDSGLSHLHLDGELYIHGRSLQDLSRLIKKQTVESLDLEYHVYDCIQGERFFHRLNAILEGITEEGTAVKVVPTHIVDSMDYLLDLHARFRQKGYEGTMLRFSHEEYRHGKRSRTLLKVKEFHDAEFEVIGVTAGKPLHSNGQEFQIPVWQCITHEGGTFNVTAQGDMYEKDAQWKNRDAHFGEMLTVKYHYLSKDGIPQLPVALRWREDV